MMPCTISRTCPSLRLFHCEHGFFTWHPCQEQSYDRLCNNNTLAEMLVSAPTQACMSQDHTRMEMIWMQIGDDAMYFEVTPCPVHTP